MATAGWALKTAPLGTRSFTEGAPWDLNANMGRQGSEGQEHLHNNQKQQQPPQCREVQKESFHFYSYSYKVEYTVWQKLNKYDQEVF